MASRRTRLFTRGVVLLGAFVLAVCLGPRGGAADGLVFGPHDVRSVFYVAKSENQNQVHYAIRLDPACRPPPRRPVWAYWKRVKEGRHWDAPLSRPAEHVYGVGEPQRVRASQSGGSVELFVRALEQLRIEVRARKAGAACEAIANATIAGRRARLSHAYLQLRPLRPRPVYVEVIGFTEDGRRVSQRYR